MTRLPFLILCSLLLAPTALLGQQIESGETDPYTNTTGDITVETETAFNNELFTNTSQGLIYLKSTAKFNNNTGGSLYNTAGNFESQSTSTQSYGIKNKAGSSDPSLGFYNYSVFTNGQDTQNNTNNGAWFTNEGTLHNMTDAVITNYGRLDNTGRIFNNQTGSEIIIEDKGSLYNTGTVWSEGTIQINSGGRLFNAFGATLSLLDDWGAGGPSGTAVGALLLEQGGRFTNNGNFYGDTTNSGTLGGDGQINGNVVDNGTVAAGNSAGVLTILGDYTKVDGNKHVELGGLFNGGGDKSLTEHDWLHVTGNVELAGQLDVELINGFELHRGNSFTFLQVDGTLTGEFDDLGEGDLVGNFGGQDLFITYGAGDGNDVGLFTNAVPEPTTALVWSLLAGLGLTVRRRR